MELPRRGQAMKKLFPAGGGVPLPPVFCPARYQTAGRPPTCDVMRPPRRARSPGRRTLAERLGRGCLHGQAVTTNQRAGGTYQPASVAPRLVRGDDRPPTDRPGGTCPAGFSPGRGEPGLPDGEPRVDTVVGTGDINGLSVQNAQKLSVQNAQKRGAGIRYKKLPPACGGSSHSSSGGRDAIASPVRASRLG